jgi:hypothetical protein
MADHYVFSYQITIATLLLCDNPNYVEEEQEMAGITCKPLCVLCLTALPRGVPCPF